MSLYNLARQVQSKGRGDDSMLVHMTPSEVKGLQSLAMAHGGSLSINPDTGLPEAGFLKNILPSVVGGAVGIATMNPMLGAAVGGGLGMATSGGNLTRGIMSGIGAYGFGSLGASLATSGAQALAPEAIAGGLGVQGAATGAGSQAAMLAQQNAGFGLEGINSIRDAASTATGFSPSAVTPVPSTMASIQEGFKGAASSPGAFFKQNMFPIGAAVLPTLMSSGQSSGTIGAPPDQGQIRPYTYSQQRNPNYGLPGEAYFTQSYTAGQPYAAKEGGLLSLARGGMASGPVERMSMNDMKPGMYPQGMMDKTEYATPTQRPASMEIIKSDYDTGVNPMTGMQDLGMANGGVVALATGGVPNEVTPLTLAPTTGRYTQSPRTVNPAVTEYNRILMDRAANEYITQPPPLATLPGRGERASAADTSKIINEYYLKNLGRQGEQAGLDYWTQRKMGTGESLADINKAIAGSPEAQVYGAFQDLLGRRPEEAAYKHYQYLLESGTPIADIRKSIQESPEFLAKNPITKQNFDAAAYLAANPDIKRISEYGTDPYLHYERHGKAEGRAAPRLQTSATPATATATGQSGFKYDPTTGRFSGGLPQPQQQDFSGFMNFANDPNFQAYLQNQYNQFQQAQQGGGKAGGLMPNALKLNMGGGISDLGSYSDGGRLLKGPGDGVSDSIPAQIGNKQPARLADGEFVIPARIVSELGNGSTDAGARKLYAMMDRVQKKRANTVGKGKVAVNSKAERVLPA